MYLKAGRRIAILLGLCVTLTLVVYRDAYAAASLITSDVRYRTSYMSLIGFADGSSVEIMDPHFKFRPIWKAGEKLEIRFDSNKGASLYDPVHHIRYQILEFYNRPHPIDLWLESCFKRWPSQIGHDECQVRARKMWIQLIRFDYRLVADNVPKNLVLPSFYGDLSKNEKIWNLYRKSFKSVIDDDFKQPGSYWSYHAGNAYLAFLRNQDRIVLSLLGNAPLGPGYQVGPTLPLPPSPLPLNVKH